MTIPLPSEIEAMQAERDWLRLRVAELEAAINAYLDNFLSKPFADCKNEAEMSAAVESTQRVQVGLLKVMGRKVPKPDFQDDDISWHIGQTPEYAEKAWLDIWGEVVDETTDDDGTPYP